MKNKHAGYLIHFNAGDQIKNNPEILRIVLHYEYTRIDFGYVAPWIYDRGGWIDIGPNTFLRVHGSKKRYQLKEAINIPLSPEKHDFESTADWRVFTLLFEPIPVKKCTIDMIESEKPNESNFNFYEIMIEVEGKIEVEEMNLEINDYL